MKFFILLVFLFSIHGEARRAKIFHTRHNDDSITNFQQAKTYLKKHLDLYDEKTIYCSCGVGFSGRKLSVDLKSCGYKIQSDAERARRVEWEHVVPAEAFGQSFVEWRSGTEACKKGSKIFKGRKCAETNAEFNRMESDLYNLFPEIGELNGLRSNFTIAALTTSEKDFGGCKVKLADRKFEPQDASKGIVARTYMNFENRYPGRGIVSEKNKKLFEAWDKMYPVSPLECKRWKTLEPNNGYRHLFVERCK